MQRLIVLCGPTASGKTNLSIELAQRLHTHILSCDGRQFYREMNIGTAKPTLEERAAAPHHFVDNLSIQDNYSVGDFERDVLKFAQTFFDTHEQLIMVGGSGLYIKAVCEGLDNLPQATPELRAQLKTRLDTEGLPALQKELQNVDPTLFARIDIQNPQRVIRGLEVFHTTGTPLSSYQKAQKITRPFSILKIGLDWPRETLYQRINQRVDLMLEAGLEAEARALFPQRHLNALQTVGYQEFFSYFEGLISREEAIRLIKRNSRRYAKRQMTWFRKDSDIRWFAPQNVEEIWKYIVDTAAAERSQKKSTK